MQMGIVTLSCIVQAFVCTGIISVSFSLDEVHAGQNREWRNERAAGRRSPRVFCTGVGMEKESGMRPK